jgi:putative FmdB family regulatory protein
MPTYEYKCRKCRKTFEHFQKMTDKPLTRCVRCKGPVERLIGAGAGLIFKGSGFYITDYKKTAKTKSKDSGPEKKT